MEQLTSQSKKTILFYHPDRYTGIYDNCKAIDNYLEEHVPCNFIVAQTWEDFVAKLDLNPDLVGIQCDIFESEQFRIAELITTISATLKIKNKQAKICVSVNSKTSKETINKLRKTNIVGVQFGAVTHGLEIATTAWQELLNSESYWPEELISKLDINSSNKKPLHIYFGDNLSNKPVALTAANEVIKELKCTVTWCTSLDELSNSISENPRTIAVHIDIVRRCGGTISEFMLMIETMIKYANLSAKPNIAIVIESDTHLLTIKELRKHRISGIIPSAETFNPRECITAINSITDNQSYWPKDIIAKLPGNEPKLKNKNSHSLTGRQQEVFDLIANRGLSNKQIARVLNISESTVKIHVSAVMKNLCVRNRTQLALTK